MKKNSKCSDEHRKKISEARIRRKEGLGYLNSLETRKKISLALKGRKLSDKHREKIGLALIGNKSNSGKKLSKEHREKISNALKGRKFSKETLLKMSNSMKGKKLSEETKEKISKACGGRYGSSSSHWKGGKTKNNGYIYLKNPEHLFCNNQRYVLEHRLIMEKFLGRLLKLEEVVHHKNNVRDDNRIENLMLFEDDIEHRKYHRKLKQKEAILI